MRSFTALSVLFASVAHAQQTAWGQCGGMGWSGQTSCIAGYHCVYSNPWYSQCLPGGPSTTAANPPPTTTAVMKTTTSKSTTASATPTQPSGKVAFAGVNIAGFDFGCGIDGTCNLKDTYPPLASQGGPDGLSQMQHFVRDDHMNIFRLPVAWQYLQDYPGANLNSGNLAKYDQLVQACLSTGASCIIDIHNYARWNGAVIGQGGPTNAQFANLWSQIASKYASSSKVIFGVMNEPHDLNVQTWATSVQAAVTAIRGAGATSQLILLPGTDYTSAGAFISNGSGAALIGVKNPDGSTTNLIFDVHKYLDYDNSGTHPECTTNNVDVFNSLASWLRSNRRQALLSETGGGNVQSCVTNLCQEIATLNANSDVLLGYVGWAAGSFLTTYTLSETPNGNNDQLLVKACLAR